jgi:FixJ family two-component response regulator
LIAIVDDDASVRRALSRLLSAAGHAVQDFACGAELLRALALTTPSCIVLDLHMPGVNGFEVQAALAEDGWRIPIIVITADPAQGTVNRALSMGAVACLEKPVDSSKLLETIAKTLQEDAITRR